MGLIGGIISGLFAADKLEAFIVLGIGIMAVTWAIDTFIIVKHLGTKLNTISLTDKILFNEKVINPSHIVKIHTVNIYPNSIIAKWRITMVEFFMTDQSVFRVLAKPDSVFYYLTYFFGIFEAYSSDRWKYKTGRQGGYKPLAAYFVKETTRTLSLLVAKYPRLGFVER